MPSPNIPSFQPPAIPQQGSNRQSKEEKRPGGCLNVILISLLIFVVMQMFLKKPEEKGTINEQSTLPTTMTLPSDLPKEKDVLATLPKDLANAAQSNEKASFVTLGSLDANSPYRMLVTLTNRGAAVARIELNEKAYRDTLDKTGYLGQIVVDETIALRENKLGLKGVAVQTVGLGTPAEKAGLKPGDRIVSVTTKNGTEKSEIKSFDDLRNALFKTVAGETVELGVIKAAKIAADKPTFEAVQKIQAQAALDSRLAKAQFELTTFSAADSDQSQQPTAAPAPETVKSANPAENKTPETKTSETKPVASKVADVKSGTQEKSGADSAKTAEKTPAVETVAVSDKPVVDQKKDEVKNVTTAIPKDPINIAPENVSVTLTATPVSIVRPESFIRTYNDYINMAGLQGKIYGAEEDYDRLAKMSSTERKQNGTPHSFLMTLGSYDDKEKLNWLPSELGKKSKLDASQDPALSRELPGIDLRDGYWNYAPELSGPEKAVFRKIILSRQLEVLKIYSLKAGVAPDAKGKKDVNAPEYHLTLRMEIRNLDRAKEHSVSYILDGPSGLPMEGAWYSSGRKTGPKWGLYGLRDIVVQYSGKSMNVVKCSDVAQGIPSQSESGDLDFIGVDSQYFQCTMLPNQKVNKSGWLFSYIPIRAGVRIESTPAFTNTTFRMKTQDAKLAPFQQSGDTLVHEFTIFAGPKQPKLLKAYQLEDTIVYGWFWFVSIPLLWILHFFKMITFNYALAIILLTILVRLILFPLTMKQNASMQKMQLIQPEVVALKEQYKDDPQAFMKAQRELYSKYKINPLGGCLPMFLQLPIFIGLYKALSLDVNLYGVPLFSENFRWCSNLAAPDMFIDWSGMWNSFGLYGWNMGILGPYLNLLPLMTIVLFILQQKFLMPQTSGTGSDAQQQKQMRLMMNFMMILMAFMFFKVPSGLCIYFIVSSIWGVIERKCMPKSKVALVPVEDAAPVRKPKVIYEPTKKGKERNKGPVEQPKTKGRFRAWLEDALEKAREQQKLAKAEAERRQRKADKYKSKGKRNK